MPLGYTQLNEDIEPEPDDDPETDHAEPEGDKKKDEESE